jgi:malonyl CoA-acyl carrier protein transacylase
MDLAYIQNLSPKDRLDLLKGDAIEILENTRFTKPLTPEEVTFYKSELSENSIKQSEILEEKKEAVAAFTAQLKPVQAKISESLKAVKYKAIDCEGTIYRLADFDDKMIHTVDGDGNLINSRAMLPAERQLRIQALKQETA